MDYDAPAIFSPDRQYRYMLRRPVSLAINGVPGSSLLFVMLNPSLADETRLDNTVSRCLVRAQMGGYERLEVVNLFALRSPYPKALYEADDPIGPENDDYIVDAARRATKVILAWGAHGSHLGRAEFVYSVLLRTYVDKLHYLALTKTGHPQHPLHLPYALQPTPIGENPLW